MSGFGEFLALPASDDSPAAHRDRLRARVRAMTVAEFLALDAVDRDRLVNVCSDADLAHLWHRADIDVDDASPAVTVPDDGAWFAAEARRSADLLAPLMPAAPRWCHRCDGWVIPISGWCPGCSQPFDP